MIGFNRHNIKYTSASSINKWAEDPAAWVAHYLLNVKFTFSPAARAGVLAEDAVVNVLARGMSQQAATDRAVDTYAKAVLFDRSEKTQSRLDMIPGMIDLALKELKQYGDPEFAEDGKQKKIEINCRVDDWAIPVIGFLDLHYPQHGLVIDLKTSSKLPSEMSKSHLRQQAIYKAAMGNCAVKFVYVTGKKCAVFESDDTSDTLKDIKAILKRQNAFLSVGDIDLLKSIVPVVPSFYFNDDIQIRRELYGY